MEDNKSDLIIRRASKEDTVVLADFSRNAFEEAFGAENDPDDMQVYLDTSFSKAQIGHELTDPETTFLLIYQKDMLVGYAKIQGGPPPDRVHDKEAIQLSRLYVISACLGRGLGSQLIQACFDESRQQGYETIWLGVWEENVPAQRLYERSGFIRAGTKEFILGTDVQQDAVYARSL
jgi:ribosomal protein S18 acetylase RimI-like enzyme